MFLSDKGKLESSRYHLKEASFLCHLPCRPSEGKRTFCCSKRDLGRQQEKLHNKISWGLLRKGIRFYLSNNL